MNNAQDLNKDQMFIYFSQIVDKPVIGSGGGLLGYVYDIIVEPTAVYPQSAFLIIRKGLINRRYAVVKWIDLLELDKKEVRLKTEGAALSFSGIQNNKEEMALRRDILDQQVVDTYNHKVIRVNDIHLLHVERSLMIAHVDISVRGLMRRLGWEGFIDLLVRLIKPKAEYLRVEHLLSWKYIQPLSINPVSMSIKVDIPHKNISSIPAADLGEIFQDLNTHQQRALFKSLDINSRAKIFSNIDFKNQKALIGELEEKEVAELLNAMPSDEATDFLEKLSKDTTKKFLALMESKQAKKFSELMGYSSDSAGGLMTKDFMAFNKGTPVEEVVKTVKERYFKLEPVQFVYIVDEHNHFVGSSNFRYLMLANPKDPIEKAAFSKTYYVHLDSSVKEVAYLMEKYKYNAIAVVDAENKLQGIITVDDILSQLIAIAWRRLKKIKALPQQNLPTQQPQAAQQEQSQ